MFMLDDCLSSIAAAARVADMRKALPWYTHCLEKAKCRRSCTARIYELRGRVQEFELIAQYAREYAADFGDEYGEALALAYEAANVAQAAKALAKQFSTLAETLPYLGRATRK